MMNEKKIDRKNEKKNAPEVMRPDYAAQVAGLMGSSLMPQSIRQRLNAFHDNDIAGALALLSREARQRLYAVLDAGKLADVLGYCEERGAYIDELTIAQQAAVLSGLEPADAAQYLQQLDKRGRANLLELMTQDARREVLRISAFDQDEIGSRMTNNFIRIEAGLTVKQAMRALVDQAAAPDNISTLYVTEPDGTLAGAIALKDLIVAREGTALAETIRTSHPYVYASEEIADCIERIREYEEDSVPVLDQAGKLVGVLTAQELTELVDDEMGEDYAKLAGLSAEEDLNEPLSKSIRKRLPWLVVLLGLGLVVSGVVGLFEQVVASLTRVVCFQSLILDMSGNVGTQSLAVTIRVLMDETLRPRQKLELVIKETRVGLCNGMLLGALSFGLIGAYLMLKGEAAALAFSVSACTGIALLISMVLSSICGTVIPLIFERLHIDPAVASGPLITTINDLVAVVTYYGLAWLMLIHVLHLA